MKLDVILKLNEPAPWAGILVDEKSYRFYQNEITALEFYEATHSKISPDVESNDGLLKGILIGLSLGCASALMVHYSISH